MNLPNLLSLVRLCLVPVFVAVFFRVRPEMRWCAAAVYLAAFLTDVADGWIARRFHLVTRLGRILDPVADKLMTFAVIVCIVIDGIVPAWAAVVFFGKEVLMALGGVILLRCTGDVIPANWLGKLSTGVFFAVCAALVLFPAIPSRWATGMISAALALTLLAFFVYLRQFAAALA